MKNLFLTVLGTVLISSTSFANNPVKDKEIVKTEVVKTEVEKIDNKKTEVITEKLTDMKVETKAAPPESDWAGFVCWLFGGHCQPL